MQDSEVWEHMRLLDLLSLVPEVSIFGHVRQLHVQGSELHQTCS